MKIFYPESEEYTFKDVIKEVYIIYGFSSAVNHILFFTNTSTEEAEALAKECKPTEVEITAFELGNL